MKDQEVIEYGAVNVLARQHEEHILQFQMSNTNKKKELMIQDSYQFNQFSALQG
jgi:hypothetical protein